FRRAVTPSALPSLPNNKPPMPSKGPMTSSRGGLGRIIVLLVIILLILVNASTGYLQFTAYHRINTLDFELSIVELSIHKNQDKVNQTDIEEPANESEAVVSETCQLKFPALDTNLETRVEERASERYLNFFTGASLFLLSEELNTIPL